MCAFDTTSSCLSVQNKDTINFSNSAPGIKGQTHVKAEVKAVYDYTEQTNTPSKKEKKIYFVQILSHGIETG